MPALLLALVPRHWSPNTDEAMSASSRMAQEMEEAKSEGVLDRTSKEKERDWWSIDLEGEVEELEVGCPWTVTKGDSMDGKRLQMNHQSDGNIEKMRWKLRWKNAGGNRSEDKTEVGSGM